jgi:hypothetical protein
MFLIKSHLEGTTFTIRLHENQAGIPVDIDVKNYNLKATSASVLTKFPIGTTFIVTNITWGSVEGVIVGSIRPLFYENTIYALSLSSDTTPTNADVEYMIDWMISHPDYRCEKAKEYAAKFTESGYKVDVESKCKSYKEDTTGTLRDRIIRTYPCPSETEIGFHVEPEVWYLLVRNIMKGENTLIIGPTGTGKTELISHVVKAMGKFLKTVDMGTVQDAQSALLGVHRLNKEGHSEFDYAPFVDYVQQPGIVLLDEINR